MSVAHAVAQAINLQSGNMPTGKAHCNHYEAFKNDPATLGVDALPKEEIINDLRASMIAVRQSAVRASK